MSKSTLVELLPSFEGVYSVKIDPKGRFVVPAEFYRVLQQRVCGTVIVDPHYTINCEGILYKDALRWSAKPKLTQQNFDRVVEGVDSDIGRKQQLVSLFDLSDLARTVWIQQYYKKTPYAEIFPSLERSSERLSSERAVKVLTSYSERAVVIDAQKRFPTIDFFRNTVTLVGMGHYFLAVSQQP